MIQGDFRVPVRPKTEGFSGGQFCLGIETLHNTNGKLPLDPEPVEQQRPMPVQYPRRKRPIPRNRASVVLKVQD
ncbi:hypothetical protein, partial [Thiolapillus sp.]|uniref:hypothetical protein n=1 Tax=Thiolapillus sp. TaxID=2017437 RepID=UPI003AF9F94C